MNPQVIIYKWVIWINEDNKETQLGVEQSSQCKILLDPTPLRSATNWYTQFEIDRDKLWDFSGSNMERILFDTTSYKILNQV